MSAILVGVYLMGAYSAIRGLIETIIRNRRES